MTTLTSPGSATRRVAVVTAGLSQPSSTRLLADRLAASVTRALGERGVTAEATVVELRSVAHDLTDHLLTGFPSPALADVIDTVTAADGLVAVTPVFTGSYSGLFKTFFDVIGKESLAGTPVLVAATAGTARHSLVLEHAMRPLFTYLRSVVVPTGVFAAAEDWGSGDPRGHDALQQRVDRAADELADLVALRRPKAPPDPFTEPMPFETLLAGGP